MSDKPNEIYDNIKETLENRRDILKGEGEDYAFKPIEILTDPELANEDAQAVINEVLNEEEVNIADVLVGYKVANGICGIARDNLALSASRIANIVGYLNEINLDIEDDRLGAAIPGYEAKEE